MKSWSSLGSHVLFCRTSIWSFTFYISSYNYILPLNAWLLFLLLLLLIQLWDYIRIYKLLLDSSRYSIIIYSSCWIFITLLRQLTSASYLPTVGFIVGSLNSILSSSAPCIPNSNFLLLYSESWVMEWGRTESPSWTWLQLKQFYYFCFMYIKNMNPSTSKDGFNYCCREKIAG